MRKSSLLSKRVICVRQRTAGGQINTPTSESPQNVKRRTRETVFAQLANECTQSDTHIENKQEPCHLELGLDIRFLYFCHFFVEKVGRTAPRYPQAKPGASKRHRNEPKVVETQPVCYEDRTQCVRIQTAGLQNMVPESPGGKNKSHIPYNRKCSSRGGTDLSTVLHASTYIYIYIYVCITLCIYSCTYMYTYVYKPL